MLFQNTHIIRLPTNSLCIFFTFGIPNQIHIDQGRELKVNYVLNFVVFQALNKTRTTPYRPQSDGIVEIFNRTLITMYSAFVNENKDDCDDRLTYLMSVPNVLQIYLCLVVRFHVVQILWSGFQQKIHERCVHLCMSVGSKWL